MSQSKTIQTQKLNVLDYFKIIIKNLKNLKFGTCGNKAFAPILHPKNHILIPSNNTYMANQRMKVYFVDFFSSKNFLLFAMNVTCNLSNLTIKILVANVACN